MKPIKLNNLPPDPCVGCIVQAACTQTCDDKRDYADWIRSKYYGHQLNVRLRRKCENAHKLHRLFVANRKHSRY